MHKRVPKVWGSETWIVNSPLYCGKLLHLRKDFQCSMHYHRLKDETFYISSGKVKMETCDLGLPIKTITMIKGDSIHISPLTVHRFTGLEDSVIIEFSTQHIDSDSYRFTSSGKI